MRNELEEGTIYDSPRTNQLLLEPEIGYIENVLEDEGNTKSVLWFYGEQLL